MRISPVDQGFPHHELVADVAADEKALVARATVKIATRQGVNFEEAGLYRRKRLAEIVGQLRDLTAPQALSIETTLGLAWEIEELDPRWPHDVLETEEYQLIGRFMAGAGVLLQKEGSALASSPPELQNSRRGLYLVRPQNPEGGE